MTTAVLVIDVQQALCTGTEPAYDVVGVIDRINVVTAKARADDVRVRKTTPDSFNRTELHAVPQAKRITHLVICGLQSDFCVDTTVRRALALGYEVVLVSDGHSTMANGVLSAAQIIAHHNATLSNITSFGPRARLIPAAEIGIEI